MPLQRYVSATPLWTVFKAHHGVPFPSSWRSAPPPSPPSLPLPPHTLASLAQPRERVRVRAVLFTPSVCSREHGGFSKGGQRCVNSKQRNTLLYCATYCTFRGRENTLCPLCEPSFSRKVLMRAISPPARSFRVKAPACRF